MSEPRGLQAPRRRAADTGVRYTEFRPKWHRERVPVLWWVRRRSYLVFVLRELSAVFVAWSVAFLLLLAHAIAGGEGDYRRFLDWSGTWWVVLLNIVTVAFVVFHAVTWFRAAPQAMVVRLRGRRVPPARIAAGHYAAWALLTVLVAWLVLG